MNLTCSNDIVWSSIDKGALLVRPADGTAWTLNASAAFFWSLCESTSSDAQLANAAICALGWSRARARQEIAGFIDALKSHRLIHAAPKSTAAMIDFSSFMTRTIIDASPVIQLRSLGANARRRPSPRGNSGPG